MTCMILVGDCRTRLADLPDGSINTCVTSPPYFGLRDYGHDDQIGAETTPGDFVAAMVAVFRDVRRVLRDDGTVWLNLGDSYARNASKGGSGPDGKNRAYLGDSYGIAQSAKRGSSDGAVGTTDRPGTRATGDGMKEKDLLGIPWRVAFALQADGWYLRQDIIWAKPNPMPESVTDRCTKAHEYVFLLSKGPRYYFDHEAIKEPAVCGRMRGSGPMVAAGTGRNDATTGTVVAHRARPSRTRGDFKAREVDPLGREAFRAVTDTRNRRSVWTVPSRPFKGAHFATFPPDLIEPCVLAGCPVGGFVLDPFGGAGTTGLVAEKHGRDSFLVELNPTYAAMARDRVGATAVLL